MAAKIKRPLRQVWLYIVQYKEHTYQTNSFICKQCRTKVERQFIQWFGGRTSPVVRQILEDVIEGDAQTGHVEHHGEGWERRKVYQVPDVAVRQE